MNYFNLVISVLMIGALVINIINKQWWIGVMNFGGSIVNVALGLQ